MFVFYPSLLLVSFVPLFLLVPCSCSPFLFRSFPASSGFVLFACCSPFSFSVPYFLAAYLAPRVLPACLAILRYFESLSTLTSKMFKGRLENYIMRTKERLNFYPFHFVGLLDISSRIEATHYEYHILDIQSVEYFAPLPMD